MTGGERQWVATVKPRPEYSFAVCFFNKTRNPSSNFQNFNPMSLIRLPTLHSPLFTPLPSTLLSITFSVICLLHFAILLLLLYYLLLLLLWVAAMLMMSRSNFSCWNHRFIVLCCSASLEKKRQVPDASITRCCSPLPRSVSFSLSPSYSLQLRPNQSSSTAAKPPTGRSVVF